MSMIVNPFTFGDPTIPTIPAQRMSFGARDPGSIGANNGTTIYNGEHDASLFTNTTGFNIPLDAIVLMGATGTVSNAQFAIYANSSGAPGALIEVTEQKAVAVGETSFALNSTVTVNAGDSIFIAGKGASAISAQFASAGDAANRHKWKSASFATAFSNPFGSPGTFSALVTTRAEGLAATKWDNASTHAYWRIRAITLDGTAMAATKIQMRSNIGGGDLCSGGTAISKSYLSAGTEPDKAFDTNDTNYWLDSGISWIGYHFASPVAVREFTYKTRPSVHDQEPLKGVVEYSDDGTTWVWAWAFSFGAWTANETKTGTP